MTEETIKMKLNECYYTPAEFAHTMRNNGMVVEGGEKHNPDAVKSAYDLIDQYKGSKLWFQSWRLRLGLSCTKSMISFDAIVPFIATNEAIIRITGMNEGHEFDVSTLFCPNCGSMGLEFLETEGGFALGYCNQFFLSDVYDIEGDVGVRCGLRWLAIGFESKLDDRPDRVEHYPAVMPDQLMDAHCINHFSKNHGIIFAADMNDECKFKAFDETMHKLDGEYEYFQKDEFVLTFSFGVELTQTYYQDAHEDMLSNIMAINRTPLVERTNEEHPFIWARADKEIVLDGIKCPHCGRVNLNVHEYTFLDGSIEAHLICSRNFFDDDKNCYTGWKLYGYERKSAVDAYEEMWPWLEKMRIPSRSELNGRYGEMPGHQALDNVTIVIGKDLLPQELLTGDDSEEKLKHLIKLLEIFFMRHDSVKDNCGNNTNVIISHGSMSELIVEDTERETVDSMAINLFPFIRLVNLEQELRQQAEELYHD